MATKMTSAACLALAVAAFLSGRCAAEPSRWAVKPDGSGVAWNVAGDESPAHSDFIEMSGLRVSLDCAFSIASDQTLALGGKLFWPSFRVQPNNTYGTLSASFDADETPSFSVDGELTKEVAVSFRLKAPSTAAYSLKGCLELTLLDSACLT